MTMAMKCDEVGSECYSYLQFISFRVSVESEKGEMNRGAVEKRREAVLLEMIIIYLLLLQPVCLPRYVRIWLVTPRPTSTDQLDFYYFVLSILRPPLVTCTVVAQQDFFLVLASLAIYYNKLTRTANQHINTS